jgi:hypothetical protein
MELNHNDPPKTHVAYVHDEGQPTGMLVECANGRTRFDSSPSVTVEMVQYQCTRTLPQRPLDPATLVDPPVPDDVKAELATNSSETKRFLIVHSDTAASVGNAAPSFPPFRGDIHVTAVEYCTNTGHEFYGDVTTEDIAALPGYINGGHPPPQVPVEVPAQDSSVVYM